MINIRFAIYAAAVLAVLGVICAAYSKGYSSGLNEANAACFEREEAAREKYEAALQTERDAQAGREAAAISQARKFWEDSQEQEVITETIEKEVIKYVTRYRDSKCQLDADFLRIWNAANANSVSN